MKVYELPAVRTINGDIDIDMQTISKGVVANWLEKEAVVNYMKSGFVYAAIAEINHDIFTGETIPYEAVIYTDKKYRWTSELLYYVETYNVKPEKDFIEHALKNKEVHLTKADFRN